MTDEPDPALIARRYVDLWQRQVSGVVPDPSVMDAAALYLRSLMGLTAPGQLGETARNRHVDTRSPSGRGSGSGSGAEHGPAGPAPASAASGDRDGGLDEFARRLAACEERIADLEGQLARRGRGAGARSRRGPA
ncbi:hypothetical protein [Constrictibacter sp. MBR-5]|jgi:hypothetical protein|uniref:hypothetical protein n=1 Tax=Constrictibacter sp. MBR-5 TaxID=3156467 RepID=UPI0033960372